MKSDKIIHSTIDSKKNRPFTLIEILVVISIIAILMALLMPAIGAVTKSSNKTRTKEMANAIVTAIAEYELEYSIPPEFDTVILKSTDTGKLTDKQYDMLVQILTFTDMPSPPATSGASNAANLANAREIQFLEPPNNFTTKGYVDPWGNRFVVSLDYNYDKKVTVGSNEINTTNRALVYSKGPDGVDNDGEGDDICSWE